MKHTYLFQGGIVLGLLIVLVACSVADEGSAQAEAIVQLEEVDTLPVKQSKVDSFYALHAGNTTPSTAHGTVSKGSLENGHIFPFSGNNWHYFDSISYINARCFSHSEVVETVLNTYKGLEATASNREFGLMECSNQKGGKLWPHRTHQNGLSIDFMIPLLKDGEPYTELDYSGAAHYFLNFDDDGYLTSDKSISIDFELMGQHLIALDDQCKASGMSIKKVLLKIALKDNFFASESGKEIKKRGIYFAKSLEPVVDNLHDDHYHVDFNLSK